MPRKRPLQDPDQFYTYVWRLDGEVLWVGQGKNNRGRPTARACWNGRPAGLIEVLKARCQDVVSEIIPCNSELESIDRERQLIAELKPKFNTAPQRGGWKGMHSAEALERLKVRMIGNTLRKRK